MTFLDALIVLIPTVPFSLVLKPGVRVGPPPTPQGQRLWTKSELLPATGSSEAWTIGRC